MLYVGYVICDMLNVGYVCMICDMCTFYAKQFLTNDLVRPIPFTINSHE